MTNNTRQFGARDLARGAIARMLFLIVLAGILSAFVPVDCVWAVEMAWRCTLLDMWWLTVSEIVFVSTFIVLETSFYLVD